MIASDLVSLIIATYNRGHKIGPTLDSVNAQSRAPNEILVVDDCSTDGTGEWIRERYPNVRVVKTPQNLFTAGARNFGAAAATGKILVFLDHDDLAHIHAVETLLELLSKFPAARASYADHRYINRVSGVTYEDHHRSQAAFGRLGNVPRASEDSLGRLYRRPMFYALLHGNLLQQPWAVYKETFFKVGGFSKDVRYCEDWDLFLRVTRTVSIALTDSVISDHIVEGENLHLAPNQVEMYRRVLKRLIFLEPWNARLVIPVLKRLAQFAKTEGDRAPTLPHAWNAYLRSFLYWPLDHVVVARAFLIFPFQLLLGNRTSVQNNER